MCVNAPFVHILTPSYEKIPAKILRPYVKNYGKGTGSQVSVFTVNLGFLLLFFTVDFDKYETTFYAKYEYLSSYTVFHTAVCIHGSANDFNRIRRIKIKSYLFDWYKFIKFISNREAHSAHRKLL